LKLLFNLNPLWIPMTPPQLTKSLTEADLQAKIPVAIRKAFPWLPAGAIRHQTKFSFTFGHATIVLQCTC
jgi:hypothetical protein